MGGYLFQYICFGTHQTSIILFASQISRSYQYVSVWENINPLYSGGFPHTHVYNEYWMANFVLLSGHRKKSLKETVNNFRKFLFSF